MIREPAGSLLQTPIVPPRTDARDPSKHAFLNGKLSGLRHKFELWPRGGIETPIGEWEVRGR